MTTELRDGTIIPSFLGTRRGGMGMDPGMLSNLSFRLGEVKRIIYPSDQTSISKQVVEYDVMVQQQDGSRPGTSMMYHNCTINNLFGGVADKFRYTLRASDTQQDSQQLTGNGSKVLLLCINGQTNNAVILGGIRTPLTDDGEEQDGETADQESDGHNLYWMFNGLNVTINDDGELAVTFNGATQADGSLADGVSSDAQGSTVTMTKDGSVTVTSPDGKQSVKVNHSDHKIEIQADQEMTVNSNGQVNIQSTGVIVGDATDQWPLFSTYREQETLMNTQVSAADDTLAGLMTTAGTALATAGALNIIPMVGGILSSPFFITAGVTIASMSSAYGEMGSAIDEFEAQAEEYLSEKNQND